VLPLVVGQGDAARVVHERRRQGYVAQIRFGSATRTYDAEPEQGSSPLRSGGAGSRRCASERARYCRSVPAFTGRYLQTPPAFSAKKVGGTPAYKLARAGKPVDITPVEVHVSALNLETYADGPGAGAADVLERLLRPLPGARARAKARLWRAPGGFATDSARAVHSSTAAIGLDAVSRKERLPPSGRWFR
jgi:hypothetical protein